ncbi:MAG: TerD family protein [Flavobacteriales bacterium]|nr:TerD family protein [Flavobacteriales bacterium]
MAINLTKGQRIDLTKKDSSGGSSALTKFCVGVNWGALEVEKKKFFGGTKKVKKAVDLDLSCMMVFKDKERFDHIYSPEYNPQALAKIGLPPGKLYSRDGALQHSGDDRTGDLDGDDGLDNEIISVDLTKVNPEIEQIFFFLNNATNEDFYQIPFAKIRMYEGTPTKVDNIYATFDVVSDAQYSGRKSMIMGKLYRKDGEWKFNAIGDATTDQVFAQTMSTIIREYA